MMWSDSLDDRQIFRTYDFELKKKVHTIKVETRKPLINNFQLSANNISTQFFQFFIHWSSHFSSKKNSNLFHSFEQCFVLNKEIAAA